MKQHWKKLTATVTALALALTLLPPVAAQAMAIKAYELVYEPTYQQLVSEGSYTANRGFSPRGAVGNTLIVREGVYVTPNGVLSETDGVDYRWGVEYLVTVKSNGTVTRTGPFLGDGYDYWPQYHIGEFNEAVYAVAYDLHGRRGIVRPDGWAVDPATSKYNVYSLRGTSHYVGATYETGPDTSVQVLLDLDSMQEVNYTKPNGVILDIGEYSGGNLIPGWNDTDKCYYYYDLSGNKAFDGRDFELAYAFSNDYAWVYEDGVYKLIDTDGVVKFADIDQTYGGYHGLVSKDNIAVTTKGYVNLDGDIICKRGDFDKYRDETFHPFRNGYGRIDVFRSVVEAAYGDALIDTKGDTVISPEDNLKILGDISADGYFIGQEAYDNGWEYSFPQLYCLGKSAVMDDAVTTVPYFDRLPEGHTYTLSSGSLPAGLTLSETGEISGTPTSAGKYKFTVKQDSANLLPCILTVKEYSIVASGYCGGDTTADYDAESGCYKNQEWKLDSAGLMTISGTGKMTNIDSMADLPVSSIVVNEGVTGVNGWWLQSFGVKGRTGVKSLALPASLTEIEELDILCTNLADSLAEIRVADGNNIYCDVDGVLFSKDQKTLLCYPSIKEATSYVIPSTVTSIGARAFDDADKLKSITIPNGVVSIGLCAFDCCDFLENITIPASVTSVGVGAFVHCSRLTSIMVEANNTTYSSADGVLFNKATTELIQYPIGNTRTAYTIPSSVTSIDDKAFLGCQNLTSITIPTSVTSIGYGAFAGCSSLTDVYYTGSKEEWKQISIGGWSEPLTSATIHYNSGTPLPNAVKYVPYSTKLASISVNQVQLTYALATGDVLPDGLSLSESGEISGIPTKSGTFTFTVLAKQAPILAAAEGPTSGGAGGVGIRIYQITVQDNSDNNVAEAPNVPEGYEITEEVEDMKATSLSDQVFEIKSYSDEQQTVEEENFGDFMEVYLDGRKLVGGKLIAPMTVETVPDNWEYYAEQGSTKITIRAQTFAKAGSGTHTIAAEFREGGVSTGELKTVAQNFKITSTSSGGGGGSSTTTYKVTAPQTVGGKIAVTPENAAAGKTVTLRVTPDVGYQLREITVGDVKLTKVDDSTYTFTMPKNKVEIKAAFEKITSANTTFTDINESAWYFEAARYVYEKGLMRGVTEDSFAPGGMMTRAMLLTVLSRYAGADLETTGHNWYVQSVEWAKANGISDGLNPRENITREQVATMLYRYAGEPEMAADLSAFSDENSVSGYAAKAMQWAVANGLINGMDSKLAPQAFATRAQLAAIIMRYCENVAK